MSESSTAAAKLAAFCADIRWDDIPLEVRERTKDFLLDSLGVTFRGTLEASSKPGVDYVRGLQTDGPSSVIGEGFRTSAPWAALVNGTAAHAIEMDDVTSESSLHPAVCAIPAAVGVAEERGADGAALVAAIVAGYEVTLRVGNALNPSSAYQRGFHPTSVSGVFGAATAAAHIMGLNAAQLTDALGICGSMASGSMEYLTDGAWTKRINAGWAAHAGTVAAGLAAAGFNGPPTIFEGPHGFLTGFTDEPKTARLLDDLGDFYQIQKVSIKPYGCCRYNHGIIDCMFALREEHGITPEQVEKIRFSVLSAGRDIVAEPIEQKQAPENVVDAQFSAHFAAAVALARGVADVNQFTPESIQDPVLRDLTARTEHHFNPEIDRLYPLQWRTEAEIELRDGRVVATEIDHATGEPENPVPREDLVEKFILLAEPLLQGVAAQDLTRQILTIDREPGGFEIVMSTLRR